MKQESESGAENSRGDISTFASGASIVFSGRLFRSFMQYVFLIVISRILGVETFGLFMLGFTIISFLEVFARMGLDNAAIRFVSMHVGTGDEDIVRLVIRRSLVYALLFSLLITFALYTGAGVLALQVFEKPELERVIQYLALSVPFLTVMAVALAVTQGFKQMQYTAYCRDLFFPLVNLTLVIVFYLFGSKLTGVMLAWILASISSLLVSLYYLNRVVASMKSERSSSASVKARAPAVLGYASPLLLIVLLTSLLTWVDTLMLGYFRSSVEVGQYGAAVRTAMLTGLILVSVNAIFSPMIADLYNRRESARLEAMLKFSGNWIYILSLPCCAILVLFSREIMALFGADFVVGWKVLVIVSCAYFLNSSTGSVGNMLIMSGHQRLMLYNSVSIFVFNCLANYLLIPPYGMNGAAIASATSIVLYNILMLAQVYLRLGMHPYNIKFVRVSAYGLLCTLAIALLIQVLPGSPILRLLLGPALFLGIYFLLIFKSCIGDEERFVLDKLSVKLAPIWRGTGARSKPE